MSPQNWHNFEEIFQTALDLSGDERKRFLEKECGGDVAFRAEIEKYIAGYEEEENFLESPVWSDSRFLNSGIKKELASSLEEDAAPYAEAHRTSGTYPRPNADAVRLAAHRAH